MSYGPGAPEPEVRREELTGTWAVWASGVFIGRATSEARAWELAGYASFNEGWDMPDVANVNAWRTGLNQAVEEDEA